MKRRCLITLMTCVAWPCFVLAQESGSAKTPAASTAGDGASGPALRRSNRMEFDGRLIKGERAAGAVYLFNRAPRKLPPLLKLKRDELDRIVWPVLKRNADRPVSTAKAPVAAPPKAKSITNKAKAGGAKSRRKTGYKKRGNKRRWKVRRRK